jgi:serine/threonine-protein kinase
MDQLRDSPDSAVASARPPREWRLASDVVIRPVADLADAVRELLMAAADVSPRSFALQRRHARTHPKVVSPDIVAVLRCFGEAGATYAQVLDRLAVERGLDRSQLDMSLRPVVTGFVHAGILIEAASGTDSAPDALTPSLAEGEHWLDYRIIRNVHCMIDSEIYQVAEVPTGRRFALKIMQESLPNAAMRTSIDRRLAREFSILARLRHPSIVGLHREGVIDGRRYGILDWIDGPSVTVHAQSPPMRTDGPAQLALGLQCLEAVGAVHEAGYLHGDIHPGNFLVEGNRVRLIDFGLARPIRTEESESGGYEEGGVLFYMPPEYAMKVRDGRHGFHGSIAAEVYSCAVVLHVLFTGELPYAWKTYREDFLRSLLRDPPRTFADCGHPPWPELESVLQRALRKKPQRRFATLRAFRERLARVSDAARRDSHEREFLTAAAAVERGGQG